MAEQVVHSLVVGEALAALPPPFRAALLLVFSQGLTYREAAEVLGEPVGTIKWRVSEATRRVRRHLEAMETDGDGMQQTVGKSDCSPGCR
jgi:DNA-directed RNA polymerase specialized sigma24 family protein